MPGVEETTGVIGTAKHAAGHSAASRIGMTQDFMGFLLRVFKVVQLLGDADKLASAQGDVYKKISFDRKFSTIKNSSLH
jgi:hypothetical protein